MTKNALSAIAYQFASVALVVLVSVAIVHYVPVARTLTDLESWVSRMGLAAPVAYPAIIAASNLLLLPGGILSVGGGFLFGLWWGFTLVCLGNMFGAAGAFFLGRSLGRKRIERLLRRRAKWAHLDRSIEREGWKIVLLSQLHPLFPVSLINYIYGISRIGFWPCMLWTLVGRAPGIFLYVYVGTLGQFGLKLLRGSTHPTLLQHVVWISGFALMLLVTVLLARMALRLLAEAERKDLEGEMPTISVR